MQIEFRQHGYLLDEPATDDASLSGSLDLAVLGSRLLLADEQACLERLRLGGLTARLDRGTVRWEGIRPSDVEPFLCGFRKLIQADLKRLCRRIRNNKDSLSGC